MRLVPIAPKNLCIAIDVAREIFPNEVHKDGFWPGMAYNFSIQEKNPEFRYYLVFQGAFPVGITGHYPEKSNNQMWLGWFGVRSLWRNHGIGQEILVKTCDLIARKFGYSELYLYSGNDDISKPAHTLYRKLGFKKYKTGQIDNLPVLYFKGQIPICPKTQKKK